MIREEMKLATGLTQGTALQHKWLCAEFQQSAMQRNGFIFVCVYKCVEGSYTREA